MGKAIAKRERARKAQMNAEHTLERAEAASRGSLPAYGHTSTQGRIEGISFGPGWDRPHCQQCGAQLKKNGQHMHTGYSGVDGCLSGPVWGNRPNGYEARKRKLAAR